MKSYSVRQKITVFANKYEVFSVDNDTEHLVAYAQQKRFSFRESISFYSDSSKSNKIFEVKARNVIDLGARYDVIDENGQVVGVIGKAFGQSLITSTWHIYSPAKQDAPAIIIEENNIAVAILRRIWDFLPIVNNVPFFIKYHFDFKRPNEADVLATYRKTTLFRDNYSLDITDESLLNEHDWRTFVAVGVLLDALQSR